MDSKKRSEIEWQAIEAIQNDKGPDDNPYPEGSEEYDVWLSAWTDARYAHPD